MPSRQWRFRIEDMLEAIGRIEGFVQGMDVETFLHDLKTSDAVIRNLEILGEAARHIPDDVVSRHPDVPWKKARDMRNVLIHAYFGVDLASIWQTIQDDLPPLRAQLNAIFDTMNRDTK